MSGGKEEEKEGIIGFANIFVADDLLFVIDKSPEVDLQVVSIHLHLLETKLSKRPQTNTLQECLEKKN